MLKILAVFVIARRQQIYACRFDEQYKTICEIHIVKRISQIGYVSVCYL